MVDDTTTALSTSLLRARLGQAAASPLAEQQVLEHWYAAAHALDAETRAVVRAIYAGVVWRHGVCVYGSSPEHSAVVLETLATAIVGPATDQIVKLHLPAPHDYVARRFGALRITALVTHALDEAQHDKAWFLLVRGDDASALMRWTHAEIQAVVRAEAGHHADWPPNVVVLAAAQAAPTERQAGWQTVRAAAWTPPLPGTAHWVPPVGYQRVLVARRRAIWSVPVYTAPREQGG